MALSRSIADSAIVLKTNMNYRTHLRTYFIFCIIASKPAVDPLILSMDDLQDPHAWQVALKVDDHFTLFGMWLAGQLNASRTALHFQFSSVVDYCNGVRATVSKWWGLNLSHMQNDQLGFSTFKRGLKNIMQAVKTTRLPIAPQHLLTFATKLGMSPLVTPGKPTRWLNIACERATIASPSNTCPLPLLQSHQISSMYLAACIFGWSKLLRVSEYTSSSNTFLADKQLSRKDVSFFGKSPDTIEGVDATIKWHKTVRSAGPLHKRTYSSPGGALCLVAILLQYVSMDPHSDPSDLHLQPFFRWPSGRPLTANQLRDWLSATLASMGINASEYNTHSLRQGGASALAALGVNESIIRIIGRWTSSTMPTLYTSGAAESLMVNSAAMGRHTYLTFLRK